MAVLGSESTKDINKLINEVLTSARYLIDVKGGKTDVVLSLSVWKNLLAMLEELDDRQIVKEWLPKLKAGPKSSEALCWDDVKTEW
jgi:hypothetical protein